MPLDFAVLDQKGEPENTVSLSVDLHHELVVVAAARGLARFRDFADYYKDAEVTVDELPNLAEQIRALHDQTDSVDLQHFLDALTDLIDYAVTNRKSLYVIAG